MNSYSHFRPRQYSGASEMIGRPLTSLRVLSDAGVAPGPGQSSVPIPRTVSMNYSVFEFFYKFAADIIRESELRGERAICIIRPFPGHLTRYSTNPRFAESPLEHYLDDSLELFRHYLRYMVETQWLLSALAPVTAT